MCDTEKITIGAVVVLYNPTKEEIENINTYKDLVDRTVVVDNSADDHENMVSEVVGHDSDVIYYSEKNNLGLCKALNIGIDMLMNKGCNWALIFDSDSKMGSDVVSVYKRAIRHYKDQLNCIAVFAPVHTFDRSGNQPYKGYKDIEWAMTSGCLFNCEIFKRQSGFMEELFVDGLDIDYCFKSHENDYRVIECGEAIIKHHPADTRSFLGFKYGISSPNRYCMQVRSLIWCWRRYGKPNMFGFYLYKWMKVLLFFPGKREYIKEMIKGTKEGNRLLDKYIKS